jgi:predicted DNA-binding transcriptional regulator AlpA
VFIGSRNYFSSGGMVKMTLEERKEKQRLRMLDYYHKNKKAINRRVVAKRKADKLKELNVVVKINQKNITKKEIMSLIGVTALVLDKILKDKKYSAPKQVATHIDGTVLFNRAEVMEWLPYAREACAFIKKPKPIKLTGMSAQIVEFMRKNKEIELYCNKLRRKL